MTASPYLGWEEAMGHKKSNSHYQWLHKDLSAISWNVLNWNIRGLNNEDKKKAVKAKIEESGCSVFCIQETKIENLDCSTLEKIAPKRFSKFAFVPSVGASGGILMGWNDSVLKGEVIWNQDFAITVAFTSRHSDQNWKLTTVWPLSRRKKGSIRSVADPCS
jgi:hypothetical protein